jgi:DNA polymerase I
MRIEFDDGTTPTRTGWRVVHGIVDSIWVTPDPNVDDEDREDLEALATKITAHVEIRLKHEAHYDWVAFLPQGDSTASALTKYFGKVAGDDEFNIPRTVPIEQLAEWNRVSKPLEWHTQNTQNVAALKRAHEQVLAVHPGQDIGYVVVDNGKSSRERVALAHEEIESYDASTTRCNSSELSKVCCHRLAGIGRTCNKNSQGNVRQS